MGGRGSPGRALPQAGGENTITPPATTRQSDPAGTPATTRPHAAPQSLDERVRRAYEQLTTQPGDLVSLARLRDTLPDVSRAELDAALLAMDRNRQLQLEPDPHRAALTRRVKDAAIFLGGEDMHLITINPPPQDTT